MQNKLWLILGILVLTGAGCFGGTETAGSNGSIFQSKDGGDTWGQLADLPQESGVGSIAGVNVASIEIDPSDPTAYYMGTFGNGIFFSLDTGSSWQRPEATEARSGTILEIEVNPEDVCTVYAATPSQILKSTDCMRTMEAVYVIDDHSEPITSMALDWYTPDIIWVGDTLGTVLKTDNAGETWRAVQRLDEEIMDIEISNRDSRIILIGTERDGLYRSTDSGETWVSHEDELKDEFDDAEKVYAFTQVADGSSLIMSTEYGLLLSEDQGETWTDIPLLTESGEVEIQSVAYDPENASTIFYATKTTFYASTNNGNSWVTSSLPSSREPYVMLVHPEDGDRVLIGFAAFE
ncbi:hypothetical protein HON52_01520 [Candidatus Uhrbacteria bacterium]|jgi:photosystem II stability/assembly factor-like uncharacterized protein|nr:hypothetical protein [Candidatus Uhrbacteria bacterium]